ncbi:hypothetical protein GCM10007242_16630 [Pigmentiphaga litoralis]|uniref:hypothetical protein n=1 Tax=Pigmentiphaga litoralis TaxID=516702 RepID=UPI0016787AFC|nr:hypothetical protein [Pigmentiphaga litoralis]GGX11224.1 hypothetical protein GCM10007242_16630 [Pigmentiphaga litoralis]
MRMSTDPNDQGYEAWMKARVTGKPVVYVDGCRIDKAFTADTDAGFVIAADLGPDGQVQLDRTRSEVLRREVQGVVTIVVEPTDDH